MEKKKIFVIIPDGVGLRNFVYSSFPEKAESSGLQVTYWNQTSKDLTEEGLKEIKLDGKPRAFTDIYKRAKIESELNYFKEKFQDSVYDIYKFPAVSSGFKNRLKNTLVRSLVSLNSNKEGTHRLQDRMEQSERKSAYYKKCRALLESEKPDIIFCTNQRPLKAIAPVLAANDLGITTCCFIFSWDNLPKATKVINADYYFVWSEWMKNELLTYYTDIDPEKVKVTGSPQFGSHYNSENIIERKEFFEKNGLDSNRNYLCFSGDDITTSPQDHEYLEDVAKAVQKLNSKGGSIGIIFRRAPVDFSRRYDEVISNYKDIIIPIAPLWKKQGEQWNEILPEKEDLILQTNIIAHTFLVVNLGSSMVFDYASYGKPCAFINYNPKGEMPKDVNVIYNYVHFRSMPENAVFMINDKKDITDTILRVIKSKDREVVKNAKVWFEKINRPPLENATERIIGYLQELTKNEY